EVLLDDVALLGLIALKAVQGLLVARVLGRDRICNDFPVEPVVANHATVEGSPLLQIENGKVVVSLGIAHGGACSYSALTRAYTKNPTRASNPTPSTVGLRGGSPVTRFAKVWQLFFV